MTETTSQRKAIEAGPTFIGIGAQKCATSWLHDVLFAHPDIYTSEPKEIDFFTHHFDRGYEWYERHFEPGRDFAQRGETSPSYFYNSNAPERIKTYNPNAKLIVIFRDPVERAFSNHLHELRKWHFTSSEHFADGLANNPCYVEQSRYAKHLKRWYEVFPREQILPLVMEEITKEPEANIRKVYRFLDVDETAPVDLDRRSSNESVAFRNDGLQFAIQAFGNKLRRAGFGQTVEKFKAIGPVKWAMDKNKRDLRQEVPPMSSESRTQLVKELEPDVSELANLMDREGFPWKNFTS